MKSVTVAVACLALLAAAGAAQKLPWQTAGGEIGSQAGNPQQLVHFLYPQQVTLPAGKPQTIEMHFRVNEGLHINSHEPRQKSLIRTELMGAEPAGVKIASVDFPPGADYVFQADPSQKLSVYRICSEDAYHDGAGRSSAGGRATLSGLRYEYMFSAAKFAGGDRCDGAVSAPHALWRVVRVRR